MGFFTPDRRGLIANNGRCALQSFDSEHPIFFKASRGYASCVQPSQTPGRKLCSLAHIQIGGYRFRLVSSEHARYLIGYWVDEMQQEIIDRASRDFAIEVEVRVTAALGSTSAAWEWLKEPKREFAGLSVRELLLTELGREQVKMSVERLELQRQRREKANNETRATSPFNATRPRLV